MKITQMRTASVTAVVLLSLSGTVQAGGLCSNASLRGPYGFTGHGQILGLYGADNKVHDFAAPSTLVDVAMVTFDGAGHFSRTDFGMINGMPKGGQTAFNSDQSGTYSVNPDCTGTMSIVYSAGPVPAGTETDLQMVISDDATLIESVVYKAIATSGGPTPDGVVCPPYCEQGVEESFEGKKVLIYGFR
jgi:hypothetical protein